MITKGVVLQRIVNSLEQGMPQFARKIRCSPILIVIVAFLCRQTNLIGRIPRDVFKQQSAGYLVALSLIYQQTHCKHDKSRDAVWFGGAYMEEKSSWYS